MDLHEFLEFFKVFKKSYKFSVFFGVVVEKSINCDNESRII